MSTKSHGLLLLATGLLLSQALSPDRGNTQIVDGCNWTVTANAGLVMVCPRGDGDPLTAPVGGGNSQISLTVRDLTNTPIPNIPATDMWLTGCTNALLLCGGPAGSNADAATDAAGTTTFSNEPVAGGCDEGLYVVVMGIIAKKPDCTPLCLPILVRSPDYKSAGAPGPPPCPADDRCPDLRITAVDFAWFATHFGAGRPYHKCADYAVPLGTVTAADFAKFGVHYANNHQCI